MKAYDVPRPPGLYWVVWVDGEEPTIAEQFVELSRGTNCHGHSWETLHKWWDMLGTDDPPGEPEHVLQGPISYTGPRFGYATITQHTGSPMTTEVCAQCGEPMANHLANWGHCDERALLKADVERLKQRLAALEAAYQGLADRLGVGGLRFR